MLDAITLCSATLADAGRREPPLGPLYIAAAIEQSGVAVEFRDFQLDPQAHGMSGDRLASFLSGHRQVVAISCFLDMLPAVIDATRRLHESAPDTLFVLGGPGPTASARRIVEEYPWISGVVRGEGEDAIQDWIRMQSQDVRGPIPGLVYRQGDRIVEGAQRPRKRDLDELPLPAYHLLDWTPYTHARIITTRGCSYRCSFCDVAALWGNRSVYRGLEATFAELELLRDTYGKSKISIVDDTFVLNRERVLAFCRMLIDARSGIEWGCFGRINLMDPELIRLMADAGCRAIFYGIDSGSPAVLNRVAKRLRVDDVMPVLEVSADYFENVEASFIWGYPFETLDDFRRTLDVAGEASMLAPTVNVQLHLLSPLPLSPLYREFGGDLIEPEPEDEPWLLLPPLLSDPRAAALASVIRSAPDIYPGFYTFPTPDRETKRELLQRARRALDRTVGATIFDSDIQQLTRRADESLEHRLLAAEQHPADRIGVGLAVGFLSRVRHRQESDSRCSESSA